MDYLREHLWFLMIFYSSSVLTNYIKDGHKEHQSQVYMYVPWRNSFYVYTKVPFTQEPFSKGSLLNVGMAIQFYKMYLVFKKTIWVLSKASCKILSKQLLYFPTMLKLSLNKWPLLNCCRVNSTGYWTRIDYTRQVRTFGTT